jgi:hypothetical protein
MILHFGIHSVHNKCFTTKNALSMFNLTVTNVSKSPPQKEKCFFADVMIKIKSVKLEC